MNRPFSKTQTTAAPKSKGDIFTSYPVTFVTFGMSQPELSGLAGAPHFRAIWRLHWVPLSA